MFQLQDMAVPDSVFLDTNVLNGLEAYHRNHTGEEVIQALNIRASFEFHISSVSILNKILGYFSTEQREKHIDLIYARDTLPVCTSKEWIRFLSYCTNTQCQRFLEKLSPASCLDLYDEHRGFFKSLITDIGSPSLTFEAFEMILGQIHSKFPMIVHSNFALETLRCTGALDNQNVIKRLRLIFKYLQSDLARLNISLATLSRSCSPKFGGLYYHLDEKFWNQIVREYFIGLARRLPYLFHSEQSIQVYYQTLAKDYKQNYFSNEHHSFIDVTFSSELIQCKLEESIQACIAQLPNLYQFVSQYKNKADLFTGSLLVYTLDGSDIVMLNVDEYSVANEFNRFIRDVITTVPQTSYDYVCNFNLRFHSIEEQLIYHLSNLNPYWLSRLNTHIDTLNWEQTFNISETQACFRAYIDSQKPSIQASLDPIKPDSVFFLKTLEALVLSAALLAVGIILVLSTLPVPLGATVMISGAILGFFAYNARNEGVRVCTQNSLNL